MTELEKAHARIEELEAQEVELCTLYGIVQAENGKLWADLEAICAGGVSVPLMRTPTSGAADLPEALRIAAALEYCDANVAREAINELRRLHALTAQDPSQPGGFDAGDMASAAAQGYRDGWAAAQAISAEPVGAASETVKFTDQSTVSPVEKARRFLTHVANKKPNNPYFFDDGYPRESIADDAAAALSALEQLTASHGQAPSQAGEYPALVCDYCGALTPDPWHSSGMLHGKMSKHIHSCDACAAPVDAAVQQDAARLDFIERHPEMSLRHRKGRWAFLGFTNYEYDLHQSLREAIDAAVDAARAAQQGDKT